MDSSLPNQRHSRVWATSRSVIELGAIPRIMAIVNVTPDSFSDGGKFSEVSRAVDHAMQLVADGADILDIGGESTRPYSTPVDPAEELKRVVAVIEKIAKQTDVPISIDTSKAVVARAAVDAGAQIINDVMGLEGDPEMVAVANNSGVGICAMHMQGNPQTMQDDPSYENVVEEIFDYLKMRKQSLLDSGIEEQKICLDPGIGFGKTHAHNWQLLRQAQRFSDLNSPILIGHSRKGFLANVLNDKEVEQDSGTLAVTMYLAQKGVDIVRVHEVARTRRALTIAEFLLAGEFE